MGRIFEPGSLESQWIVFRIQDRRFAIEAKVVNEILSIVPFNPSFLGGPGFFATFPLRGKLVYTFDLRYYWGEQPMPYSIEDNLLLLDNRIAIPVQEVLEIRELDLSHTSSDHAQSTHLIRTEIVEDENVISLLDSESLLRLTIELEEESVNENTSSNTKIKLHWFKKSTIAYSNLDKEILARRKQAYEKIETSIDSSSMVSLAVIESVNEKFCLPIDQILEFAEPGQITPIPGSRSELHGFMNLRGEVVPVLSLAALMGKSRKYAFTDGKIILVKDQSLPLGIIVDELLDVVNRKTSERILTSISSKFNVDTSTGSLIEASFPEMDGSHLNQLSLESLFNKAKSILKT